VSARQQDVLAAVIVGIALGVMLALGV